MYIYIYIYIIYILYSNGFKVAGYADDHQVYKHFDTRHQFITLTQNITDCLQTIQNWMSCFFLKLNPQKTEVLLLGNKAILSRIAIHGVNLPGGHPIRFVGVAKNLGVYIDQYLTFNSQVSATISSCFAMIRRISKVKHFLPRDLVRNLIISLVINRIDMCNSLYYGINLNLIAKLQSLQNSAARISYGRSRREGVSDIFQELHWLPVKDRVYFKIILHVHNCIHGTAPVYLQDLIVVSRPDNFLLALPHVHTKYGTRAFAFCGPKLWNALSTKICLIVGHEPIKRQLKHMFFYK